jgi:diguanylate cyclase (GGDEF)-like protein
MIYQAFLFVLPAVLSLGGMALVLRHHPPMRTKTARTFTLLGICAVLPPLAANLLYLAGLVPHDLSGLAFLPSCACLFFFCRSSLFADLSLPRRALLDALPDGVLLLGERGEVLQANAAAVQMLGLAEETTGIRDKATQAIRNWPLNPQDDAQEACFSQAISIPGKGTWQYRVSANRLRTSPRATIRRALVMQDETALQQLKKRLEALETYDESTGLYNRRWFTQHLRQEMARCEKTPQSVALACVSVVNYKEYCYVYGSGFGHALLSAVGARIEDVLRPSDAMGYFSDEELYIYFRYENDGGDVNTRTDASMARLYEAMAAPFQINNITLTIRLRAGVAFCPQHTRSCDRLIAMADAAKRSAGSTAKRLYNVYRPRAEVSSPHQLQLGQDLHSALSQGALSLVYQPQINVRTRKVIGAEALLRWQHPQHGLILPIDFIPIAEENGSIHAIGYWVLEQAIDQLAAWEAQGIDDVRMGVNVSLVQLTHADFADQVLRLIERTGINPRHLELEITESIALFPEALMHAHLPRLRERGVRIAMDDFGMGHSSLSYIKEFGLDTIKLDLLLAIDILSNQTTVAMVRSVQVLCDALGIEMVAEYVEQPDQAKAFEAIGCFLMQGFVFSPPLRAEACKSYILKANQED